MPPKVTNHPITSHDEGPQPRKTETAHRASAEPRKPKTEDQGAEQKAANKNPDRAKAADRETLPEQAEGEVTEFLEKAKADPALTTALAQHKTRIPDPGVVSPGDPAANIPVSEVAAGITPPPEAPVATSHVSSDLGPDPAFGDPDSIAAWERRHAEEAKLRKELAKDDE